jgi:hypothetical protein
LNSGRAIYGVDFSGALDAGKKIWVTRGAENNGVLCIKDCLRGSHLPGSSVDRMRSLHALREYIRWRPTGAFGLDFPFGLPGDLVQHKSLIEFLVAFPGEYKSPEKFRDLCLCKAGGREKKRKTEAQAKTPFSPYNLRIYKQTFFGISAVLSPLICNDLARIHPVQRPSTRKPLLLEICPASTLKRLRLYGSKYKGRGLGHRKERASILRHLEERCPVRFDPPGLYRTVMEDTGGDALDSVIAATAVHRALNTKSTFSEGDKKVLDMEGYVYF